MTARLVFAVLLLLAAVNGGAHEIRPASLQLTASLDGTVALRFRVPVLGGRSLPLEPVLPGHCAAAPEPGRVLREAGSRLELRRFDCGEAGLSRGRLAVEGLDATLTDVLVRVDRPGRDQVLHLLRPGDGALALEDLGGGTNATAYFGLGVEHILLGLDHLAFVLGLVVLVRGRRRLVATITAFTLAHSLTLAAAALGLVRAPPAVVEALVALSILLLAVEIRDRERGRAALTARVPWLVAFGFGLLHGFGFAGALARTGLPPDAVPMALALFNVGVEAGQLAFLAAVAGVVAALPAAPTLRRAVPTATAWLIGAPAAYWSVDRIAGILAPL